MQLDYRKRRILQAIINEYIDTAEPVGSRSIAKKHELGLSSATIRNEIADLEEMGFLAQPHASAGRIPSDKGYRLYVDRLMATRNLTVEEIRAVTSELDVKINELEELIKSASSVISKLTNYTAVTIAQSRDDNVISAIEAVPIGRNRVCVIVVSDSGTVKNSVVNLREPVTEHDLTAFEKICKKRLYSGAAVRSGQAVYEKIIEEARSRGVDETSARRLLAAVTECVRQMSRTEVFLNGTTNIMSFPEFHDIERAREFLEVLEEKKSIGNVLTELAKNERIMMLIGNENPIEEIKECSIIGATYSAGNTVLGTIGVIGPKRMEYSKVVSIIEYINSVISGEVEKLSENPAPKAE